jgi:hypothetical protein
LSIGSYGHSRKSCIHRLSLKSDFHEVLTSFLLLKHGEYMKSFFWLIGFIICYSALFNSIGRSQTSNTNSNKTMAAGYAHTLVVLFGGDVVSFGYNFSGQLGDGLRPRARSIPRAILTDVEAVFAGYDHSFALKKDGTLWGFGDNSYSELGDTGENGHTSPLQILNDHALKCMGFRWTESPTQSSKINASRLALFGLR